jgi:hypothetical protein
VGTLFVGAAISDRTLQVRGTMSESKTISPQLLADELRSNPGSFYVILQTSGEPKHPLRGQLRQARR